MSVLDALGQGATVVTANDRLARHLRWRFDQRQLAEGNQAWPTADIQSWTRWLETLYLATDAERSSAKAVELLSTVQARLVWRDIIEQNASLAGDSAGALRSALEAWRLMRAWGISVAAVRRSSRSADTDTFANWAVEYERRCREGGWIDPWSLPDHVGADIRADRINITDRVIFAGFAQSNAQQSMIQSLLPVVEVSDDVRPATPALRVDCDDPEHERDVAARWARWQLEEQGGGVVAIVSPDLYSHGGAIRRACLNILAPEWRTQARQHLPVNMPSGQPLSDTGLVRSGLLMLKMTGGRAEYRELGQLLRSTFLRGSAKESGARAAMDLKIRERNQQIVNLPDLLATAGDRHPAPIFLDSIRTLVEWGGASQPLLDPAEWALGFGKTLSQAGWLSGLTLVSDDYQAAQAWSRLLQGFARSSQVLGRMRRDKALAILNDLAREQYFQPEGRMDGVQIMGPEDVPGHRFDAVWVMGLSSDTWPPAASPHPLIPFDLQEQYRVPNASPLRTRERAAELTIEILSSAPAAIASYPQNRGLEKLVPSPLLPAECAPVDGIERYTGPTFRETIFDSRLTEKSNGHDPAPPLESGAKVRGGSQLLKWQAACPARAFFEFRLGAREMPAPTYGIDALLRGTLLHDALEVLYTEFQLLGPLPDIDPKIVEYQIDHAIKTSLRRHISRDHPLAHTLSENEALRMRRLLSALVEFDRARPRFDIEALETRDSTTLGSIDLSLRQDRIDRLEDGHRLVLDYKTGAKFSIRDWLGERPAEPQLPLYATRSDVRGIAVILMNHEGVKVAGVGDDSLAASGLKTVDEYGSDTASDWKTLVGEWERVLTALASEFARGDCRIDRNNVSAADGEFAMLTRLYATGGRPQQ